MLNLDDLLDNKNTQCFLVCRIVVLSYMANLIAFEFYISFKFVLNIAVLHRIVFEWHMYFLCDYKSVIYMG